MLIIPSKGFYRSIKSHNISVSHFIDWIEGSIVFKDDIISKSDITDILEEEMIYDSQDYAREFIDNTWNELTRRQDVLKAFCPYKVDSNRITRIRDWKDTPAYSFCLYLTMQVIYRDDISRKVKLDYLTQGILFEKLTASSLECRGLSVHITAWSKQSSNSITDKVAALANHLGEYASSDNIITMWTPQHIKDGGLDIACNFMFADRWSGRPLYFIQCASGDNWKDKKSTPNLSLWEKLIQFSTKPQRGIAIPFALLETDFRLEANYDDLSFLLDRNRISAIELHEPNNWPPNPLRNEIISWTENMISGLPSY